MTDMNVTDTSSSAQTSGDAVAKTIEELAPVALGAAAAAASAGSGNAALALQLVPVAIQAIQSAQQLAQAGALSPAQLAALFAQIGAGIKQTHDQWEALNNKAA